MTQMRHALVIGGSGMLAKASLWLADHCDKVSVIGRNPNKLNRLLDQSKCRNIIPIVVDYYDKEQFRNQINHSMANHGPFEMVVAWIHSQEKGIIDIVCEEIQKYSILT